MTYSKVMKRHCGKHIVSMEHARFIRGCYAEGWPVRMIARSQGTAPAVIYHVLTNRTWREDGA
jgi:hypothetical protein